jgi:hypothetical protein
MNYAVEMGSDAMTYVLSIMNIGYDIQKLIRNMFPVRYGLSFLPTGCICVFRMVLTINSDRFPKQH